MDTVANVFALKAPTVHKSIHKPADITNPELLIGMELEIEELYDGLDRYIDLAGAAWSVVEDGSLRPRNRAWEFVSKPMPLATAVQELRLLLGKMKLTQGNYSDRTSVHVHTNVQDYTQEQLATLCLIYTCVEDVLFQFINYSGVDKKVFPDGMSRDTNVYCVPWSACRMNSKLIEKLIFNPGVAVQNWQKYTALNLIPIQEQGTVEWRHLHGTNNMDKLVQWLNIIGSIMQFSKKNSFEDVVKALKQLNDVSTYQQFFTSVVGNHLPYSEEYRPLLAEGCINAKYSLINWEVLKKAGAKSKPVEKKAKKEARFQFAEPIGLAPEEGDHVDEWVAPDAEAQQQMLREAEARIRDAAAARAAGGGLRWGDVAQAQPAQPGQFNFVAPDPFAAGFGQARPRPEANPARAAGGVAEQLRNARERDRIARNAAGRAVPRPAPRG